MTQRPWRTGDWRPYYQFLHAAGYTDKEIAEVAGVTRFVVNRVRLGKYDHNHTLSYNNANAVLNRVEYALQQRYASPQDAQQIEQYRTET